MVVASSDHERVCTAGEVSSRRSNFSFGACSSSSAGRVIHIVFYQVHDMPDNVGRYFTDISMESQFHIENMGCINLQHTSV